MGVELTDKIKMLKISKNILRRPKYQVDVSKNSSKNAPKRNKYARFESQEYYQPEGHFAPSDQGDIGRTMRVLKANFEAGKKTYVNNTTLVIIAMVALGLMNRPQEEKRAEYYKEMNKQGCDMLRERNEMLLKKREEKEMKKRLAEEYLKQTKST